MTRFVRLSLVFVSLAMLAGTARADVAPDPLDPASPISWVLGAVIVIAVGAVIYFVRRRRSG